MEVRAAIRSFIAENFFFCVDDFSYLDTDSFLTAGIIDSLGVMDLVAFVGASFGVTVAPEEVTAANFDTVDGLVAYIERKRHPAACGEQACSVQV
jgi:acyl carrier protein